MAEQTPERTREQTPERTQRVAAAWHVLVGRPLRARELSKEQITPVEGLSALSLDALTSVAYGPEAIIVVLAAAGSGVLHLVLPVEISIVLLLGILVFSYRQVIDAYPGGGGAYAVSRANLGPGASLLAGASLVVDYTLTVAVSIAAGVGALTSAFPSLTSGTVPICLGILAVVTLLNLRGLGETARAFLLPTTVFIVGLLTIIFVGLVHPLAVNVPQPGRSLLPSHPVETLSVLLVLKAFSAGCSALTGVEAIANGVPLFRRPKVRRAKQTELLLGVLLGVMLLGLAELARRWHIGPRSGQTVLSQIMGMAVGRHWAYYLVSLTITMVLALAANTSFGGLPVLASLLSRDNYLPHLFALRGDRQVFSNGIWTLTVLSGALLVAVDGNTNTLIPLFAIGVFTGFTLSQSGLVVHWWRTRPPRWQQRAVINATGAAVTAVATAVFLFTKFTEGAWVVVVAIPLFILLFRRVFAYYARVGLLMGLDHVPERPVSRHTTVVVPVAQVSRLTQVAISEAISIGQTVFAVTVELEEAEDGEAESKGSSGDGASGDATSGDSASGDSASGDSASGDSASVDEPSGDGPSGDGPSGDGPSGDGPKVEGGSGNDRDGRNAIEGTGSDRVSAGSSPRRSTPGGPEGVAHRPERIDEAWARWDPGVPLEVLHTEFASVVDPIVAFIDDLRSRTDDQIVVLIPVVLPSRIRHRILHNQIDLVLSSALRTRTDVVVARVAMPLHEERQRRAPTLPES